MRLNYLTFFLIVLLSTQSSFKIKDFTFEDSCISQEELKLFELVSNYRKDKKLPKISLSKSLTYVAQTHARDIVENMPNNEKCNWHSWSNKGKWSSCCYTPDHSKSECMWSKPRELISYTSNGYEISYWHSEAATPEAALEAWQKSKGHNEVIINKGIWKNQNWNAIGIGIYKNYACIWFGAEKDSAGEPKKCN